MLELQKVGYTGFVQFQYNVPLCLSQFIFQYTTLVFQTVISSPSTAEFDMFHLAKNIIFVFWKQWAIIISDKEHKRTFTYIRETMHKIIEKLW